MRTTAICLILAAILATTHPLALAQQQQPYVLGPSDVIEVLVFGNPDLSRIVTVRPDGMISLPLIGEVVAASLTPEQLRARLTELFSRYVRDAQVTVIVKEFRRVRVSVLGQVAKPGVYDLPLGATVLDALAAAEGLTPEAGLAEARLIRRQDPPIVIDLERLLRGETGINQRLEDGDAVVVPEDLTARVYVVGEVTRPGVFPLRGPMTVVQAMTLAGGPTRRARLDRASVLRRTMGSAQPTSTVTLPTVVVAKAPAPGVQVITVDLLKVLRQGDISRDIPLQRGDVVYVPENLLALENIALILGVMVNLAVLGR